MNPNRKTFGRLTINGDSISLGHATVREIIQRAIEQYGKKRYEGEQLKMAIEISDMKMAGNESVLTREQQLEAEMQSLFTPVEAEVFPGVTAAEALEAFESPEYRAYEQICEPTKRIGVPDQTITEIREAYAQKFPNVFPHSPVWRAQ